VLTEHERAALLESGRAFASAAAGNSDQVLQRIRGVLQAPDRAAGASGMPPHRLVAG
jgi:hypothetical protein